MSGNKGELVMWVERLVEATGWRPEPRDVDWEPVQAALGSPLPEDYRRLCAVFGPGSFSAYLSVLWPIGGASSRRLLDTWEGYRRVVARTPGTARSFGPHGLYEPASPGLLQWGDDQTEGQYYWLADSSVDPAQWPVVARKDATEPWHRFAMSTSEVIYRVVADPEFTPFTVAQPGRSAFYLPLGQTISSAQEWDAYTNPAREGAPRS